MSIELPPLPLPIERLCQVGPLLHAMDARERILLARIAANDNALSWIGELLAVMHADGGHYLAKHGMEKAIGDAMDKYHAMHQRIAELEKQLGEAHCDASHYASRVAELEKQLGEEHCDASHYASRVEWLKKKASRRTRVDRLQQEGDE